MAASRSNISRRDSEELVGDPLDKREVDVFNKHGVNVIVPALHKGFAADRMFMPFVSPPAANSGKANLEQWQESMNYLQEDLQWLLRLPHHRFWSQVVYHEDLHRCLLSYLSLAPRPYDRVHFSNVLESSQQELLQSIHRLVFFVYLRMSTFKESKNFHISPLKFGDLIYEHYLFDIPKILDICALYGNSNGPLLQKMLHNIFSNQPQYLEDLSDISSLLINVFESNLLMLTKQQGEEEEVSIPGDNSKGSCWLTGSAIEECLDYLLDTVHTLCSFLDVYPPACSFLHDHNAEFRIACFYSQAIEVLQEGVNRNVKSHPELQTCLDLCRSYLLKLFRDILSQCCIQPILDASSDCNSTEVQSHVQELFSVLESCLSEKKFICDYHSNFSIDDDLDILNQTQCDIDEAHSNYILQSVHAFLNPETASKAQVPLASLAKPMHNQNRLVESSRSHSDLEGACAGPRITGVELDSLISGITSILPDCGEGFVEACLEYYNYNSEETLDRILQKDLPETLSSISRSLPRKQVNGVSSSVPSDSGLGLLSERKNIFDGDEFDVFSAGAQVDLSKIHKGKKSEDSKKVLEDKEAIRKSKSLYARYDQVPEDMGDIYEDEYDDTYDSVSGWAEDPVTPDPMQERRAFTVPRVLRGKGYVEDDEEQEDNVQKNSNWSDDDKEESQRDSEPRHPQNSFKNGPTSFHGARSKTSYGPPPKKAWDSVQGKPKGQGQDEKTQHGRSQKERHKSSYANHNRRAQADRKRNQGMIRT